MSGYDDDGRDMTGGFELDSGGGGSARSSAAVAQFIDDLRGLADQEPPAPSPELAAVLAGTARPPRVRRPARARVVVAVAACAVLGGAGVAAAQGRLPQPAQRVVSDFVDNFTPFTVPARPGPVHPSRTTPDEPDHRPGVGPPGVGRHSDSEPGDDGAPSAGRSHENEAPDPVGGGGAGAPAENEAPRAGGQRSESENAGTSVSSGTGSAGGEREDGGRTSGD